MSEIGHNSKGVFGALDSDAIKKLRSYVHRIETQPPKDPEVGPTMLLEPSVQAAGVDIEAVGVLHRELTHPQQARFRTWLVTELGLYLVPDLGKVSIGEQLSGK